MMTIRRQMIALLAETAMDARQLSQSLHIREKEVYAHLDHIACSLSRLGQKIWVTPYRCLSCGYEFKDRVRYQRPGRCPNCRESHIDSAVYRIVGNDPVGGESPQERGE